MRLLGDDAKNHDAEHFAKAARTGLAKDQPADPASAPQPWLYGIDPKAWTDYLKAGSDS